MAGLVARMKYLFTGRLPQPMGDASRLRPMSKIDAAQTTDENRKHWSNADSFSADAAYDQNTRWKLRNRARYETINNCYAKGSVKSAADDLIGTGPRLQLQIPGDDTGKASSIIERSFGDWQNETRFALQLRTAEKSRNRDGECFGLFDIAPDLTHPVKLYIRWNEAEMCASPYLGFTDANAVDGIRFDRTGRPIEYSFLVYHPGNTRTAGLAPNKTFPVPANQVMHWYSPDRFGQHRAIPEITPALPLFSQLRRFTLATLTAAEFAATIAGILKTDQPPQDGAFTPVENWNLFEAVRGALLSVPNQWDVQQLTSEHPQTTFPQFKQEILNESGRALGQPLNVVTGNSSGYNFSSGRLDHLPYHRSIRILRNDLRVIVLDPVFREWESQAEQVGIIPSGLPPMSEWRWSWNWDGFDSIDQNKDATADDTRIKNGTTTYSEIGAEYGQDWRELFEQLAREKAYAEELGLPWPILSGGPQQVQPQQQTQGNDEESQPTNRLNGYHKNGSANHG